MVPKTTQTHRIITLTSSPPVRIEEEERPLIGSANGTSAPHLNSRDVSKRGKKEGLYDHYFVGIRSNINDDRKIIYAVLRAGRVKNQGSRLKSYRVGEIIHSKEPNTIIIQQKIIDLCELAKIPSDIAQMAIKSLPPVNL